MNRILMSVLLLSSTAPLHAQVTIRMGPGGMSGSGMENLDRNPAGYGVSAWQVGEWARYSISGVMGPGASLQQFRTIKVVGQDGERFWVEVADEMVSPGTMRSPIRKMLVPFGAVVENAMSEALVMRVSDSSVIHERLVRPAKSPASPPAFPAGWQKVGEETLQVRAGTFPTVHYKKEGQDLWVSAKAGPIGLVRFKTEQNTVELVAHETTGAKSAIDVGGAQ